MLQQGNQLCYKKLVNENVVNKIIDKRSTEHFKKRGANLTLYLASIVISNE
jgi:hypothetical protein